MGSAGGRSAYGNVSVGHSDGEEFLFVHSGRLEFVLGNERYTLEEGDSIYYDARTPIVIRISGKAKRANSRFYSAYF